MIVPSLKQVGPVNVAYDLAELLSKEGHQVSVKYFDKYEKGIHSFPCHTEQLAINKPFNFNNFDIIHTHGLRPAIYIGKYKSHISKPRLVTTAHNYVFQDFKYKYGILKGILGGIAFILAARKHDAIITLSEDAKRYYSKWVNNSKLNVIYNTTIKRDINADENIVNELSELKKNDSIIIGTNCSLIKRKGIDILLKALSKSSNLIKLVLIGDGEEKQNLITLSEQLGIKDRVSFLGFQKNASAYLKYYDLFVLPSRSEGFPLGILEAASFSKKVVCTNLPTLIETFTEKEVKFFPKDNSDALAAAIKDTINDDEIGSNLYLAYNTRYSPQIFLNKHIALYNKLLKEN